MSEVHVHPVPEAFAKEANIDKAKYQEMYQQSVNDPDAFWAQQADEFLTWSKRWDKVQEFDFHKGTAN